MPGVGLLALFVLAFIIVMAFTSVGIAIGDEVHTRTLRMPGARDQMRQMSVISAMDLLRRALLAS